MARKPNSYGRTGYPKPLDKVPKPKTRGDSEWAPKTLAAMPLALYKRIKAIADVKGFPVGKLLSFAAYNELQKPNPFEFDIETPEVNYDPVEGYERAQKVYDYIKLFGNKGIHMSFIALNHHHLGMSKNDVILACRYLLLSAKILEEVKPTPLPNFTYPDDYLHLRPYVRDSFQENVKKEQKALKKRDDEIRTGEKPLVSIHTQTQKGPLDDIDDDPEEETD